MKNLAMLAAMILTLNVFSAAQVSSGGLYKIEQSVIASGGGTSASGAITIEGTAGQSIAGINSGNGANYYVSSGFWSANQLAPTAAGALVSGRVLTADGRGITNAILTLSGGSMFSPRTVQSSAFGYFTFEDVEAGHSYVLTIKTKRFTFPQTAQFFVLMDNVTGITFQALPEN